MRKPHCQRDHLGQGWNASGLKRTCLSMGECDLPSSDCLSVFLFFVLFEFVLLSFILLIFFTLGIVKSYFLVL